MATGSIRGCPRKLAVVACYVPPNYSTAKARQAMDLAAGAVAEAKRVMDDPLVVLAGDFNQWEVQRQMADFLDMGGTRRGDDPWVPLHRSSLLQPLTQGIGDCPPSRDGQCAW